MGNLLSCCATRDDGKYNKYLEDCIASNKKFIDKEFPPEAKSLI